MRKTKLIYLACLATIAESVFADPSNALFQSFDNQIAIGYAYNNLTTYNPNYTPIQYTTNSNNLAVHVEQLFNTNVWLAVDGSFMFKGTQSGPNTSSGFNQNIQMLGMPASIAGKVGYSFNFNSLGLELIPYASIGRTLNYNGVTIPQNTFANSYYNYYGAGARLQYIFTPISSLYVDQGIGYLNDPSGGLENLNAMSYTTLLGLRLNATRQFQIALQGSYNYTSLTNQSLGYNQYSFNYQNTMQNNFGAGIYFAYLFNHESGDSAASYYSNYTNPVLADFDNSYSIGLGYISSKNNFNGGNQPSINTSLDYLNFNISHLFQNNVWANLNAQLINDINQTNVNTGIVNSLVPTYTGFPGNVLANVGYAFPLQSADVQFIPYGNAGVVMNINSYNIRTNTSIMNAISRDMYLQYGAGARAEYAVNSLFQIYADQLFAIMNDQSQLGFNAWRSTTTLGAKLDPGKTLQLGLKGFYDSINPTTSAYNSGSSTYYSAQQNSLGVEFDIGMRY